MGYASYLVYKEADLRPALEGDVKTALTLYAVKLGLNFAWTPVFFGLNQLGLATVTIGGLLGTLLATTKTFWQINPLAGKLMLPYIAWVSYASALTTWIWWNNGGRKKFLKKD
ncbi:hypothetical protein HK102_000685 [Quaeritorhiza haematococci]|nr:hypothetical protein HK102_000685 [Quaeritorhiza haematococci]